MINDFSIKVGKKIGRNCALGNYTAYEIKLLLFFIAVEEKKELDTDLFEDIDENGIKHITYRVFNNFVTGSSRIIKVNQSYLEKIVNDFAEKTKKIFRCKAFSALNVSTAGVDYLLSDEIKKIILPNKAGYKMINVSAAMGLSGKHSLLLYLLLSEFDNAYSLSYREEKRACVNIKMSVLKKYLNVKKYQNKEIMRLLNKATKELDSIYKYLRIEKSFNAANISEIWEIFWFFIPSAIVENGRISSDELLKRLNFASSNEKFSTIQKEKVVSEIRENEDEETKDTDTTPPKFVLTPDGRYTPLAKIDSHSKGDKVMKTEKKQKKP